DLVGVEPADRDVVEKEQGLRALRCDVVDAHGHQIDTDGGETPGRLGNERLRADAVGGRYEDGLAITRRIEPEQAAEATDVTDHLGPERRTHRLLDAGDGVIARADAHSRRLVRLTHRGG